MAQFGAPTCADGKDVCLRISRDRFTETRWVLGSWELRPERDRLPEGANILAEGTDIYTVYGPVDGYAVARALGRVGRGGWRVPYERVTGSERWLLLDDGGLVDEEAGVVVVELGRRTPEALVRRYEAGRTVRLDQSTRRTVGVGIADGRVVWRHRGADFTCLELTRLEVPVRCAFEGHRLVREAWTEPRLDRGRAFLEGYDPSTGRTTWRHRLGSRATRTLLLHARHIDAAIDRIADAEAMAVVPTSEGPRLVSLVDGSAARLAPSEALLCERDVPYRHRFDTSVDSGVIGFGDTRSRFLREPCDVRGRVTTAPVGAAGLLTGATDAGAGVWVYAGPESVEAYRVS